MKLRLALVVLSCLVSIITGLVLSRSGSPVATAGKRTRPLIGLSLDTLKEERWQRDRDNFVKNAGALGADVKVQSANGDDVHASVFKAGQDKVLKPLLESGAIEVVHEDRVEDWKPENTKKVANAGLNKAGHNFDAILASNDGTAGGAFTRTEATQERLLAAAMGQAAA